MTNDPAQTSSENASVYSCDPKTIHAFLVLAAENQPSKIYPALSRVIANTMMADVVYLLSMPDADGSINIHEGFDYQNEEILHGAVIERQSVPGLWESLNSGQSMRLVLGNDDLLQLPALAQVLSIPEPAALLLVPILTPTQDPVGGIILLSPYSRKEWTFQDQIYLTAMVDSVASVLHRMDYIQELEEKSKSSAEAPAVVEASRTKEPGEIFNLLTSISGEPVPEKNDLIVDDLVARQAEMESLLTALREENDQLKQSAILLTTLPNPEVNPSTEAGDELKMTLESLASTQKQLKEANDKLEEYDRLAGEKKLFLPPQVEQLTNTLQEMRSPVSAIKGYVDLLFGESIGSLTPVQKRFLERIKTAAQHLDKYLVDIFSPSSPGEVAQPQVESPIGLRLVIEQALEKCGDLISEKSLTVQQKLPDSSLLIQSQPDLIQKTINDALLTAIHAAPEKWYLRIDLTSIAGDDHPQVIFSILTTDSETQEVDYNSVLGEIPDTPVLEEESLQNEDNRELAGDVIQVGGKLLIRGEGARDIFIVIPQVINKG